MIICNSHDVKWRVAYRLAGTGPPTHSAIVFRMPDGSVKLMEAGVELHLRVEFGDIRQRLETYPGDVYIRRRKTPLTPDQSARLTEFALAVEKKLVPPLRFIAQITPLRSRGPVRTAFIGGPKGVHRGYICSELVVEALVAAGLLDSETARPAATYPRDLFFDQSTNPYLNRHLNLSADWHPPALWTPHP